MAGTSAPTVGAGAVAEALPSITMQNSVRPSPSADRSDQQKRPEATRSML